MARLGARDRGTHHHGGEWTRESALAALEFPERKLTQDPESLWDRVGLRPGDTVAEVGAGTGYFCLPAARRVGPHGQVFAIDVSKELVDLVRERATAEDLGQLTVVLSTARRIPLPSGVARVVLLANVLHDIPESTLSEAGRILAADGTLVNVDWIKEPTEHGPPTEIRLSPEEAATRLSRIGLRLIQSWGFGPVHYAQRYSHGARASH